MFCLTGPGGSPYQVTPLPLNPGEYPLQEDPHHLNKAVFSIKDMEAIDKDLADLLKQKQEWILHALAHHDSLNY